MHHIFIRLAFLIHFLIVYATWATTYELGKNEDDDLIDLTALMNQQPQSVVFSEALSLIDSLQRAPSCNRLATATLIDSCQNLEQSDRQNHPNLALDRVKSTFAARLAVCEILGAHADVPQQCLPLAPQSRQKSDTARSLMCRLPGSRCAIDRKGVSVAMEYVDANVDQISQCLRALESRSQWWISYSNARQNAISICHAARAEIERDDVLDTHRSVTKIFAALSETLHEAVKNSSEHANFMHDKQRELLHNLEEVETVTRNAFSAFLESMEQRISALLSTLFSSTRRVTNETEAIAHKLRKTSSEADDVNAKLNVASHSGDTLVQAQSKALKAQREFVAAAEMSLALVKQRESSQQREIDSVATAFAQLQAELRASAQLIAFIYEAQQAQAANQSAMAKSMQERIEMTEDYVDLINDKLTTLSTVIDEKITAISSLQAFSGSNGVLRILLILGVLCALTMGGTRMAIILFIATCSAYGVLIGMDFFSHINPTTFHVLSGYVPLLIDYWPALLPVLALVMLAITCLALPLCFARKENDRGVQFGMIAYDSRHT